MGSAISIPIVTFFAALFIPSPATHLLQSRAEFRKTRDEVLYSNEYVNSNIYEKGTDIGFASLRGLAYFGRLENFLEFVKPFKMWRKPWQVQFWLSPSLTVRDTAVIKRMAEGLSLVLARRYALEDFPGRAELGVRNGFRKFVSKLARTTYPRSTEIMALDGNLDNWYRVRIIELLKGLSRFEGGRAGSEGEEERSGMVVQGEQMETHEDEFQRGVKEELREFELGVRFEHDQP